ncbi:dephospho-CoA kinase [Bifidobacterium commune]|uniref:Dephospho-CoA kinase n=1 Tax=Bifidobacterium commune TaxID=1505727 RepID=A0A1C4H2S5_9BIFI|nr:dephospho-CoA kinase [Bifidobacterium commune]MBB2954956.1 dephospho-CoA kinase [Bifidobacterium commune]SCC79125.1 dephospho-CoA kinase [Bifidobacterium commune]
MRVGLTGGIAAGKSTVAEHLKEMGAYLIDYDQLAREVVEPHGEGMQAIVREFGPDAMMSDGSLNRQWMAEHVFSFEADPNSRKRLDDIEHPLIFRCATQMEHEIGQAPNRGPCGTFPLGGVIVHDVPLLAEVMEVIPFRFDHILTIEAPERVRIARMMSTRGMSREQAEDRIRHQPSSQQREAIADVVIDSTQPIEQMFECLDMLFARWLSDFRIRNAVKAESRLSAKRN